MPTDMWTLKTACGVLERNKNFFTDGVRNHSAKESGCIVSHVLKTRERLNSKVKDQVIWHRKLQDKIALDYNMGHSSLLSGLQ